MLNVLDNRTKELILAECLELMRKEKIETGTTWMVSRSNSDDEDYQVPCLGVPQKFFSDDYQNQLIETPILDPTSYYSTLDRPGILPGDCPISVKRTDVQQVVERFWCGEDCHFAITEGTGIGKPTFDLVVYMKRGDNDDDGKEIYCQVQIKHTIQQAHETSSGKPASFNAISCDDWIESFIDPDERQLLGYRLMHLFLREYGFLIGDDHVHSLLRMLAVHWSSSRKFFQANLDACILRMDLLYLKDTQFILYPEINELFAMSAVGEALEALVLFEEAAKVYLELAESLQKGMLQEHSTICNAAIAYRRMGDMETALSLYPVAFKALTKHKPQTHKWNFNDRETKELIKNFLTCLQYMQHQTASAMAQGLPKPPDPLQSEMLHLIFICLMGPAGYKPPDDNPIGKQYSASFYEIQKVNQGIVLKTSSERPKFAKKIVIKAFQAGTLAGFRDAIFSAAQHDLDFTRGAGMDNLMENADQLLNAAQQRKEAEKDARKYVKKQADSKALVLCGNCKEMDEGRDFIACPCGNVHYCSTKCQHEHWARTHRKTCTFKTKTCENCGAREVPGEKLMNCPCKDAFYCCKACQKEHWSDHKKECAWQASRKASSASGKK